MECLLLIGKKLNEDVLNCQMAAKKSSKKRTANTFMGFGIRRSLVSLVRGSFSEVGTECGEELEIRNIDNSPRCLALNEEDIGGSWFLFVLVFFFPIWKSLEKEQLKINVSKSN